MDQQINLYLPEFRVKKDVLSTLILVQALGGIVAFMLLITAYQSFIHWQLNDELEGLRAVLQEESRKTSELGNVLARRSQNEVLTARLDQAEARLESRQQVRSFLSETKLGNVAGFSEFFKDLSRASIEGLSITEFAFTNGGEDVQVNGQVMDSAMVPRYVNKLESGLSPIRAKHFSPTISRLAIEDQHFSFQLSSSR